MIEGVTNNKTLLVVLEQHFVKRGTDVYTDVQCDERFWDRYLSVFDSLIVCARMKQVDEDDNFNGKLHSSRENVEFLALPDFIGAAGIVKYYSKIKKTIRLGLSRANAAICRMPSPISMVACPVFEKSGMPWAGEMMMNPRTAYSKDAMRHPFQPVIQSVIVHNTKRACLAANGISYVTERVLQQEYPCRAIVDSSAKDCFTSSYSTINLNNDSYSMVDWGNDRPAKVVLAHTGKMSDYRKGHTVFIETVAVLREMGVDAYGILIGDGPKRGEFESLARSLGVERFCEFMGWASGFSEVQKKLQCAQFFVLPTLSEGLPRAVIEAMASGLICLANAVDGIPELLNDSCLSKTNTAKEYSEKILGLLEDWPKALEIRNGQHQKAFDYRAKLLQEKRVEFYRALREASSQ